MTNLFLKFANEYIDFRVEDKKVQIPYCMVMQPGEIKHSYTMARVDKYSNFAGKGSVEQIKQALHKEAKKNNFDLNKASSEEITQFMIEKGIGIDCSGLVYNCLDKYLRQVKGISLSRFIYRYPGLLGKIERFLLNYYRIRRISAATLTNNLNTIKIEKAKEAVPGDLIRLTHSDWKGKHVVIIVETNKKSITYASASEYTKIQGPHLGKIEIIQKDKGLESQKWLELTRDGKNYGQDAFDPQRGDSIRRLKCFIG